MITRLIALFLVAITLGGCVSIKETRTENKDGTTTIEKSVNGWAPSAYVVPRVYTPVPIYGRDHYSNGPFSYDPAIPAPHVIFGEMVSGTMREAIVNGTRRMCDVRPTAPNYCNRIMDAYSWPTLTSGWRR